MEIIIIESVLSNRQVFRGDLSDINNQLKKQILMIQNILI